MLRERLEWIPLTFRAVIRNKRRSFAMISGIALATTILSAIFLYSAVLQQENFDTIVNNAPFEVAFDLSENETLTSIQDIADLISQDDRVLDYAIFAGAGEDYSADVVIDKTGLGPVDFQTGDDELLFEEITGNPVFVNDQFFNTEIGKSLVSENFEGNMWRFGDGNSTIIARSVASQFQLRVGDFIHTLNMSFIEQLQEGRVGIQQVFEGTLTNVEVIGIYEVELGDAGLFSQFLEPREIFLPNDLLDRHLSQLKAGVIETQGYSIGIKINENKFDLSSPDKLNNGINKFINEMVKTFRNYESSKYPEGFKLSGFNFIEEVLLLFQIFNIFINIFDVLLVAPAVLLALYLLIYGIEMALEERRREIAIKKVQGANSRQIFGELRNEAIMLFLFGSMIGHLGGMFGAWLISSSVGFLKFQAASISDFTDFVRYDSFTVRWTSIIVGLILVLQIYKKGRAFIDQEVSEAVQRYEESKMGFLRRNKLDIVLFLIGLAGVLISILEQQFDVDFKLSFLAQVVVNGLGPFFFWIGGALVGARIVKWVPLKLERIFLSFSFFKDIKRILRSGLRRRGETDRLAIVIVLTLSIATLAAAQGITDEQHSLRTIEWEVGSDFQVNYAFAQNYAPEILGLSINNEKVVQSVLAIGVGPTVNILNDAYTIVGIDGSNEYENLIAGRSTGIWHSDSFDNLSPSSALKLMKDNPLGIFVSSGTLDQTISEVNEEVELTVAAQNLLTGNETSHDLTVKILGTFDHLPGELGGDTLIASPLVINKLRSLSFDLPVSTLDGTPMNATKYLFKTKMGDSISNKEINLIREQLRQNIFYASDRSLKAETDDFLTGGGAFGIPGLLSLNFIVSVTAALISTFAFTAILMERRKGEFAVLRAIGAKQRQIYKIAVGENA
ncbi:MAG: FtsX-like permease family protein, partial [Candidatus Kariarchaeaceae archaeon]